MMCTQMQLNQITGEVTREVRSILGDKVDKIILYGSYARGDYDSESDVDMMVLADVQPAELGAYRKQINRIASRVGMQHDIMVTIALKDKQFVNSHMALPFYRNVLQEGVAVYGN